MPKNASDDDIKKAYRTLAREYHPDRNPGDNGAEERFKEVQPTTLSDPRETEGVRHVRRGWCARVPAAPAPTWAACASRSSISRTSATCSAGFEGAAVARRVGSRFAGTTSRPTSGSRSRTRSRASRCAFRSRSRSPARVPRHRRRAWTPPVTPSVRRPRSRLRRAGPLRLLAAVPALPRERHDRREAVQELPRSRSRARTKRYAVTIPAGAKSGTRGLKERVRPATTPDLPVTSSSWSTWSRRRLYERRGSDLVLDVPVTYSEAALGASVEIPTPDGPVSLKVPGGTESGKLLRVKGRGVPHLKGNGRGDLLAR